MEESQLGNFNDKIQNIAQSENLLQQVTLLQKKFRRTSKIKQELGFTLQPNQIEQGQILQKWHSLYQDINTQDFIQREKKQKNYLKYQLISAKNKAKVLGKGNSQIDDIQESITLHISNWLEAVDYQHRYGQYLNHYYEIWKNQEKEQNFFYWLDQGNGKDIDLEICPRKKLNGYHVKFCNPEERKAYEIEIKDGLLYYKQSGQLLDTDVNKPKSNLKTGKFIFVVSPNDILYVGMKIKAEFHHTSFLSGGTVKAAGSIEVDKGRLVQLMPHSGHYRPTKENFEKLVENLSAQNIDFEKVDLGSVREYRDVNE